MDRKLRVVAFDYSDYKARKTRAARGLAQFIGADSARNSCAELSPRVSQFRIRLRVRVHAFRKDVFDGKQGRRGGMGGQLQAKFPPTPR